MRDGENLGDPYSLTQDAADMLHARAVEIHDLTKRLQELIKVEARSRR